MKRTSAPEIEDAEPVREKASRARPYAWLSAVAVAVLAVHWGSRAGLAHQHHVDVMVRAAASGGLFAGVGVLAAAPGVAVLSVVARCRQIGRATALGLLLAGSGTAAMGGFCVWYASPLAGRWADAVLIVASVVVSGVFGRRGDLRRLDLSVPLTLALGAGLVYTGLAFVQGGAYPRPVNAIASRFWLAGDNEIPYMFTMHIAAHYHLSSSNSIPGHWLYSDRPPLQTGFGLLQWPLWPDDGQPAYQALGTCLQVTWLPALWTVLRVRGAGARRCCLAVLATAGTGVVFFNSVYVWPKMLAGALALAALAILVSRDEGDRVPGISVLTVTLAVLGLLAHGGTAFALIALLPFAWRLRHRVTIWSAAACAAAGTVLYVPWTLFQRFVAPPADRLEKLQLAGVIPLDSRGAVQTIIDSYRHASLGRLFVNKIVYGLRDQVYNPALLNHHLHSMDWLYQGLMGQARMAQLYDLLPASLPLMLGLLALLSPSGRRVLRPMTPLAVFAGITLVVWLTLLWGGPRVPAEIHDGSYALLIMFLGLCAVAVTALPRPLAALVAGADLAWFAISWIPGLGFPASHADHADLSAHLPVDAAMLALCAAGLIVTGAGCALVFRPAQTPLTSPRPPRTSLPEPARNP